MKKYLPFITFTLAFTFVLVLQVGFGGLSASSIMRKDDKNNQYEKNFIAAKFKTLDDKEVSPSKIKAPVVIYNFWASWCLPCLEEMPSMIEMKKKFKDDDLQILSFNTDETDQIKNIKKIKKKFNIKNEFMIIPDKETKIADSLNLTAIPMTIIFNRGKVVYVSNGPMDFNSEETILKIKNWIKN